MKARKTQELFVYQNAQYVGALKWAKSGAISFAYSPTWLDNPHAFALSLNVPLREEAFDGKEVAAFFDNLLPDNLEIRNRIASKVKAESARTFDLLHAIGYDCVGALQFLEEKIPNLKAGKIKGRPLSEKDIAKRLKNLNFFPLGMQEDEPEFRISIAGAQEKTALLKWKGQWHLPQGTTPTTHILKPPMGILHNGIDLSTSVENEWLCLRICQILGLKVAESEIATFDKQKCLIIERFDRKWQGNDKLVRLPQEDLCQSLGFAPTKKYEADGGPGIKQIMALLDSSDDRNRDRENFMRSQVLFYLLAATDGHAKNYSVFLSPSGFELTPFYDVMSIFPAITKKQIAFQKGKLAMAVGNSRYYRLKQITRRHFEETAKLAGFPASSINKIMDELKAIALDSFEKKIKLPSKFPEEIFSSIIQGLKSQARRL